jgi:alanyl-tRNA synthetase
MRHHTATHVLHWALREVLGSHVRQAGSLVAPDRLRFDFTHFQAVEPEELAEIERLANSKIVTDEPVVAFETTRDEAERLGALAFFGDKYGEIVRVVQAGDFSRELCGGTHVHALGEVGPILVLSESSIGSNLRRVEALAGFEAASAMVESKAVLYRAAAALKTSPDRLVDRIERLLDDVKAAQNEARKLRDILAEERAKALATSGITADGSIGRYLVSRLDESGEFVRDVALKLRERWGLDVVVLGGEHNKRAVLVAVVSRAASKKGAVASEILREAAATVGGGAGKGEELAVGGGPRAEALEEALEKVRESLRRR